jgi:hypothetical protein
MRSQFSVVAPLLVAAATAAAVATAPGAAAADSVHSVPACSGSGIPINDVCSFAAGTSAVSSGPEHLAVVTGVFGTPSSLPSQVPAGQSRGRGPARLGRRGAAKGGGRR